MKFNKDKYDKYKRLTFDDFRKLAEEPGLSPYERIGFLEEYRAPYDDAILRNIASKLPELDAKGKTIADIGCGCSPLTSAIIDRCEKNGNRLLLIDSAEILSNLPDKPFVEKFPVRFPDAPELFDKHGEKVDAVLVYSVMHHVFLEANVFDFIDKALALLSENGKLFIGDIPNVSKRKRFLSTSRGKAFHREYMQTSTDPEVSFTGIEHELIDDGVVMGILQRYRGFGFETYLLPQPGDLPMPNRREDILIVR